MVLHNKTAIKTVWWPTWMLKRKYKNVYYFLVPIKKELDNGKSIKYKIKFIDIFRFMSSKLSDLVVDDLSEIYSRECKGC